MSFFKRPMNWLCVAASAAGLWIALGVATAVPRPQPSPAETVEATSTPSASEVVDPALERMVARLAKAASKPQ